MAQILNIDTGIKEYEINGNGLLRFNPSDPNVYNRFPALAKNMQKIAEEFEEKNKVASTAEARLEIMAEYDERAKKELSHVFGEENDFDKLLGGVSVLAVSSNGEYVVTNVINALMPIVKEGAERYAENMKNNAVAAAKARREVIYELGAPTLP